MKSNIEHAFLNLPLHSSPRPSPQRGEGREGRNGGKRELENAQGRIKTVTEFQTS